MSGKVRLGDIVLCILECTCTEENGVKGYCNTWKGQAFRFCYLSDGLDAVNCPEAQKSSEGNFYFTRNSAICNAAEKNSQGMCLDLCYCVM